MHRSFAASAATATLVLASAVPTYAQVPVNRTGYPFLVVTSCGTANLANLVGSYGPPTEDQTGTACNQTAASSGATAATNVTQFGGSAVVTGTGASGAGIPRVTFSNDSVIANTAFGIVGTLPAFASTPTFNLGTLNGAATASNQTNVQSPAGTPASTLVGVQGPGPTGVPFNTYPNASANAGGISTISRISSIAAGTNLTQAKSTSGRVYKIVACNTTTTPYRIKFYNAASANVTVGTSTVFFTRPLPAASANGGLNCVSYDQGDLGWSFSTAISYAFTANASDSDTTAPAAGAITDVSVAYQ